MAKTIDVDSDETPSLSRNEVAGWMSKRKGIIGELESQVLREFRRPGTGLTLDQLQAVVEGRNPFPIRPRPQPLHINRSLSFSPSIFLGGEGWTIWKGPVGGNGLSGIEDQDKKSLALTEIDLARVTFETTLESGELHVNGEERQRRLKRGGCLCLDAQIFQTLWYNQVLIPEAWKRMPAESIRLRNFDGTVLRDSDGYRCVLYLCWADDGWNFGVARLSANFSPTEPSLVYAA